MNFYLSFRNIDIFNMKMPKILFLCRSVPPAHSGSSIVISNLAKCFSADDIIIIGSKVYGSQYKKNEKVLPFIKYGTINMNIRGVRWLNWLQLPFLFFKSFFTIISNKCDIIVAVYPHHMYLLVGYLLSKVLKKPFYPYFHNLFSENYQNNIFVDWLEDSSFKAANNIITISEGLTNYYRKKYPDLSFSTLTHSYSEKLPNINISTEKITEVDIGFCGTINHTCEDSLLRILEAVNNRSNTKISLYGSTPNSKLEKYDFNSRKFNYHILSRYNLSKELQNKDILVLPHMFIDSKYNLERETIFPTKTIDYLLSGVPILAHVPKNCFLWEFINKHKFALLIDEPKVNKIEEGMDELVSSFNLRKELVNNAFEAAKLFRTDAVINKFYKIINWDN